MSSLIALARARKLARRGRYSEALGLLGEITRGGEDSGEAMDLRARILAQQGHLREAEAVWAEACAVDPENKACRAGLERIRKLQRFPPWLVLARPLSVGVIILLCTLMLWLGIRVYFVGLRASLSADLVEAFRAELPRTAPGRHDATMPVGQQAPPEVKLALPGVTAVPAGSDLKVTFKTGLFAQGTQLTSEAKEVLEGLGRQLEPHAGRVVVRVEGHSDDIPIPPGQTHRDNVGLGMARAVVVAEHLRGTSRLPPSALSVAGLGEAKVPYPNDGPANRARNRTVVLWIANAAR